MSLHNGINAEGRARELEPVVLNVQAKLCDLFFPILDFISFYYRPYYFINTPLHNLDTWLRRMKCVIVRQKKCM